jgi:hypothetical protein
VKKLSQRVSSVESENLITLSLTPCLPHSLTNSLTYSFTYSLTYSLPSPGDGLPSMASVTDDTMSILSESSDLQVRRSGRTNVAHAQVFAYSGWISILGFLMQTYQYQTEPLPVNNDL